MPAPVDWKRAEQVAIRFAARHPRPTESDLSSTDFTALTRVAEDRVEATTGLRSLLGNASVRVIDRDEWIRANIASFQRLLDPVIDKWTSSMKAARGVEKIVNKRVSGITAQVAGAEVGAMLGWMSGRVLGQYDLLFTGTDPDIDSDGDDDNDGAVYIVGPNMAMLEQRFGFDPEQFRLWVTLHELTHRAQFTGVPWMRGHFLSLVQNTLDLANPDPAKFVAAIRDAMRDREAARQRLRDGGIVAMVASPEQQAVFHRVAGLMSLLEGHGDVVMDRAGADIIPSAPRFARVLQERRRRINPMSRIVQRLLGLEGKMNQYAAGERFLAAIEDVGGERAVDRCWEHADNLPSLDEIRDPQAWLLRLGVAHAGPRVA